MSETAKARLNAIKTQLENDLRILTHPGDRADYIADVRTLLSQHLAAAKRSPHDPHTTAAD